MPFVDRSNSPPGFPWDIAAGLVTGLLLGLYMWGWL